MCDADKKSCRSSTKAGMYVAAAAICATVLAWIIYSIRVCCTARRERKEALSAVALGDNYSKTVGEKQDAGMSSNLKGGHLVAGASSIFL